MKKKNTNQKFFEMRDNLLNIIGDGVEHEVHGNFKYYTSGKYVTVCNLKKSQEISVFNGVMATFDISKGVSTERQLLNWYKQALVVAKKEMSNKFMDRLREKKADLLKELRAVNRRMKDVKVVEEF